MYAEWFRVLGLRNEVCPFVSGVLAVLGAPQEQVQSFTGSRFQFSLAWDGGFRGFLWRVV